MNRRRFLSWLSLAPLCVPVTIAALSATRASRTPLMVRQEVAAILPRSENVIPRSVFDALPRRLVRRGVGPSRFSYGELSAIDDGLISEAVDFTTRFFCVGDWLKIGGRAEDERFANSVLNDWARIAVISPHKLTLDHRPPGWVPDSGEGRRITIVIGDHIIPVRG